MAMIKERTIPLVDLTQYSNSNIDQKLEFVKKIGDAFHNIGFVGVINHGIKNDLIENFYKRSNEFFALPKGVKQKYEIPGLAGQRGYTSFGKEHAKHSKVADLKEFYQIGQELPSGHHLREHYPDNIVVEEVPDFLKLGIELYQSFEKTGAILLKAIAIHLNLDENYFDDKIENGNSILRAIHYPPLTEEPASAIRAEQHEDINLITLLVGASAGGLELYDMDGNWRPILPEKDEIVINVGDMLQRLTNNYLKSTTHRVVNPPREEWHLPRLSIPFFLHPKGDMDLTCLENCIDEANPSSYTPITAGAYLDERLKEIGLKK